MKYNKLNLKNYTLSKIKNNIIDGGIIYPNYEFEYLNNEFEVLTDSKGVKHVVCTNREYIKYVCKDCDFKDLSDIFAHKFLKLNSAVFGFNLKNYQLFVQSYQSLYQEIYSICIKENTNHFTQRRHYKLQELDYFPIYEHIFTSGNNHELYHYINDAIFINFKDRQLLFNRVDYVTQERLTKIGYLEMSEYKLRNYFVKRLKDKVNYVKTYNQLFNNNY